MIAADLPNPDVARALADKGLEVTRVIGQGGTATVYRAHDARLERDVAVKVIDSSRATSAALQRFQREVAVVARLSHPHILPLFDAGVATDGSIFAIMPLASGQTLRQLLQSGPLTTRRVVGLASEIADALAYAHSQGIVHRDIKPENILVEYEHAVVADFGLAMRDGESASLADVVSATTVPADERLTAAGSFVGTPLYVSPEQMTDGNGVDARSDVFSLGAVCYEMLTGVAPFRGRTVSETLAARFGGPPRPMSEHGVHVPSRVEAVVLSALRPAPDERPASATEFRDALVSAFRASTPAIASRRAAAAGVAILVVGIALGTVLSVRRNSAVLRTLDARRVVVADLDNETADSAFARWGDVAGDILATRLAQVPGLRVVTSRRWLARRQQVQRQAVAGASLRDVAIETQAAYVLSGGYFRNGSRIELILELTDARNGNLLRTFGPTSVLTSAPDSTVLTLGSRIAATLDTLVVEPASQGTGVTR
ncbi:MAG: Serine/threonine-protein kinase PknD [Gemmatimonadaceae bacterium]|nr:Serine/threonine-protein kinase PknD [Gemmatimonadaceae bacterium]